MYMYMYIHVSGFSCIHVILLGEASELIGSIVGDSDYKQAEGQSGR